MEFSWFFLNFKVSNLFSEQGQEACKCVLAYWRVRVFMIVSFHSSMRVSVSLCIVTKIISLAPYAQGLIAMMVKAEGHWKNKLELLKERRLRGQLFL